MTANGWLQIAVYLAAVFAITPLLGRFMTRVFARQRTWLDPVLRPIERLIYRATTVDETHEMRWTEYAAAMLAFSVVSMLALYAMQRLQQWLPLNPQAFGAVPPALAFNTAASFTTNTNWQAYSGESTMSYLTQMAGLALHNFTSAATGIALAIAFIRGIAQREKDTLGNFWVDIVRCMLWILLPLCLAGALFLVSQGVVQNLRPYDVVTTVEGGQQTIAQGPVASQEIIKELGTNGGGFFNANSAHPFENPTPLTNFFEMFCIFAISAGLTSTGRASAAGSGYDATSSGGTNLGPTNKTLIDAVTAAVGAAKQENPGATACPEPCRGVPIDRVTTSASGLDPDISPDNAMFQVPRVAGARGITEAALRRFVDAHTQGRQLGFLGEVRVNVLMLNTAMDDRWPVTKK
jgi:K+-transporting ATPase KdpC subunit